MPSKEITPDMFKEVTFRRREVPGLLVSKYRIYTDHTNYTLVEAENAKAALEISGIQNAVRVLHDSIYLDNVMKIGEEIIHPPKKQSVILENVSGRALGDDTPDEPAIAPEVTEPVAQEAEAGPGVAASPEAAPPLTSEDVDKLLNN